MTEWFIAENCRLNFDFPLVSDDSLHPIACSFCRYLFFHFFCYLFIISHFFDFMLGVLLFGSVQVPQSGPTVPQFIYHHRPPPLEEGQPGPNVQPAWLSCLRGPLGDMWEGPWSFPAWNKAFQQIFTRTRRRVLGTGVGRWPRPQPSGPSTFRAIGGPPSGLGAWQFPRGGVAIHNQLFWLEVLIPFCCRFVFGVLANVTRVELSPPGTSKRHQCAGDEQTAPPQTCFIAKDACK